MKKANYIYRQDHILKGTAYNRRPAIPLTATTLTIHNTGNPTSTADGERRWLTSPDNNRTASYHIVIDAHEAVEVLPLNENAWHAGDGSKAGSGNRTSIGIEICERDSKLGEYAQTLSNAVDLVAKMLHERGWGVDRLRRHYDWSGKQCPRLMNLDGKWSGWQQFKDRVQSRLKELSNVSQSNTQIATVIVNGKELSEKGEVKAGVTYVPVRAVAEAFGAVVKWDQATSTVTITK